MSDRAFGVPLAFVLALSFSSADTFGSLDTAQLLTPGSLGKLLPQDKDATPGAPIEGEVGTGRITSPIAQWLNWPNCFMGYWRRC
jgi:hypothetical protein